MSASAHRKWKGKETRTYYPTPWSDWELDNDGRQYRRYRLLSESGGYEYDYRDVSGSITYIPLDPSASESESTNTCTCPACNESFKTSSERDRHYQTIHSNNGERPHKCLVGGCSASVQSWSTVEGLRTHNKKWHSDYVDYANSQGLSSNTARLDSSQALEPYNQSSLVDVTSALVDTTISISGTHTRTRDPNRREEKFDPSYRVHRSSEFKFGRVLKVLWSEPRGSGGSGTLTTPDSEVAAGKHGKRFLEKVRRFIIVASKDGHSVCLPINTYGGQGVCKSGVHAGDHTIIYSTSKPVFLPNEEKLGLTRTPIAFTPDDPRHKLDKASRLNYAKPYTLEHNIKVWFIGCVSVKSEEVFASGYNDVNPPIKAPSSIVASSTGSGSYYPASYTGTGQITQYPPPPPSGATASDSQPRTLAAGYNSYSGSTPSQNTLFNSLTERSPTVSWTSAPAVSYMPQPAPSSTAQYSENIPALPTSSYRSEYNSYNNNSLNS